MDGAKSYSIACLQKDRRVRHVRQYLRGIRGPGKGMAKVVMLVIVTLWGSRGFGLVTPCCQDKSEYASFDLFFRTGTRGMRVV